MTGHLRPDEAVELSELLTDLAVWVDDDGTPPLPLPELAGVLARWAARLLDTPAEMAT